MALENFFTPTEMKDGLIAAARVKELVNAMLEERDSVLKNLGDVTKQWSTVASIISATVDKECLGLFIELQGVSFINKWLKDTQKLNNESSDSSVEEAIIALLHAVEKLQLNYKQSVDYGIRPTVEKLLSHSSVSVLEKAKALFNSWKQLGAGEASTGLGVEGDKKISSLENCEPDIGIVHEENVVQEEKDVKAGDEVAPQMCSSDVQPCKVADMETRSDNDEKALHHENMKDESAIMKKPVEESLCNDEKSAPCHALGDASNSVSNAAVQIEDGVVSKDNHSSGYEEPMQEVTSPTDRLDAMEISPSPLEKDSEHVKESDLQTNTVLNVDNDPKESTIGDMETDASSSLKNDNSIDADENRPDQSETMAVSEHLSGDCDVNNLEGSVSEGTQKLESPENSTSRGYRDSIIGSHSSSESEDTDFFKTIKGDYDVVSSKPRSDFDLSYGMVDALEVARQVANKVEREVEGHRETKRNSSQEILLTEETKPHSPLCGNETQTDESASKEEVLTNQKDTDCESSQAPPKEQDIENKPDKGPIEFDLNLDICIDDTDQPLDTLPTPVSTVSASRATAAPGLPESPLQFEGAHGWKGSAATSAFRPASPRKFPDSEKIDNNLNKRQNILDFDLNSLSEECGDNKAADLLPQKQILHSGESSGEAKLNLDLNRISDEGGDPPPSDWRLSGRLLLGRNGHQNASPSSSSSSMQQPLRNFDLNDQPSFYNDSSELHSKSGSQMLQSFLGPRSGNNVISIMGTKVQVNLKDFSPHPQSLLPNGITLQPNAIDANFTRNGGILGVGSAVRYPHPSMFAYNGLTTGAAVPFSQVMYGPGGPIPYMVDSRGAPVVHQLLGTAQYPQTQFAAPSIYGMHPPGFNGSGPSRPPFELNLGLMGERINREPGGLRQFLGPGTNQSLDDFRSIALGKRKEPDSGQEPYPFDYKHQYPQWR